MGSFRLDKMASFIRSLVSEMLATKMNDPRVSRFASVTRVEISGDLQTARVYVSVMGTPAEERRTLEALTHARGHIQRWVSRRLSVRHMPELRFVVDPSIKGTAETLRRINDAMREIPPEADAAAAEPDATEEDTDGGPA
ncbi:MAG: 30S ribosome-binding factor RbfA [Phycisphaerae bacterium]|nr:30S ribosome-binding factor RbfA [Phycisphaerae bacterium]